MNMPYILQPAVDETLIKHIRTWLKALSLKKRTQRKMQDTKIAFQTKVWKTKTNFWVFKWDPRAPDKCKLIRNNIHRLCRNSENKTIFPKGMRNATNKRESNLDEFIKPIIPRRFLQPWSFATLLMELQ